MGVKAIENLMQKKGKFDYILLETTGLADPDPIAAMFWLDDDLGSEIYLDGISFHISPTITTVLSSYPYLMFYLRYCHSGRFQAHISGLNTLGPTKPIG